MPRPYQAVAAAFVLALAAGCGSTKHYADLPEKNLQVRSTLSGAKAVMGVHKLDARCATEYEGVVDLDRPLVDVGLPPGRPSLLVFEFYSSSFLSGSTSIKKDARIAPRAGYRYEVRATYKDSLYGVDLFEIDPRTGARRELDTRRGC
jgi:hypothetical protein